ncbi:MULTISPECIES: endospore germination permease [Desulfitobacterium]|uniref:Spore germination protein, amino acid permease n=1 Tax=Desulfitobacterium dehalogenans (strain ATCC 51507 / DSM 9161 / JW/IU-DC1) TaxID=756499 RepID=I4AAS7_DESDJ|nr:MULTISPECIES: endospore germination permease [Desulfitobacterium]AFM01062.1 spore germination protein, amino acid permease [Desulfitobacterium dehalogenans ATCC 51507]
MNVKISSRQSFCTYFIIVSLSLGMPNLLIRELRQDFWQAILVAMVIEAMLGFFLYKMGRNYINQTIFQYSEKILGKTLGKISVGIFSIYFISVAITLTQALIDFFGSVVMPETPKYVFAFLLLLVSTYACCSGIEVIMRLSEIIAPFVLGSFLFVTLFNIGNLEFDNLRPVFRHGIGEILRGSMLPSAWFGICIIMGVLMAYHNNPKAMYKVKLMGVGLGILAITTSMFFVIMVIGVEVSSRQLYSIYNLARKVDVGNFIQRTEAFQIVSWTAGAFLTLALFHYAAVEGLKHIFSSKSRMFLGIGIAVVIFVFAIFINPTSIDKTVFFKNIFGVYGLTVEICGVSLLYIIYSLKQKFKVFKKRSSNER